MNRLSQRLKTGVAAVTLVVAATVAAAQPARTFKARLSPVPIDLSMQSTIAGSGSVTAVLNGTKLTINGTFEGLKSPATAARIHKAQKGVRGPAIMDLTVTSGTSGTISGTMELTPQQIENLQKEWFYVQLHSEKAPDGNLWGWLLRQENRR